MYERRKGSKVESLSFYLYTIDHIIHTKKISKADGRYLTCKCIHVGGVDYGQGLFDMVKHQDRFLQ
jgi:hypothetical protein